MAEGGKMKPCIMLTDHDKYRGKYVAIKDFFDKQVISYGDNPSVVFDEALRAGSEDPVIFFVPKKDVVHIYPCL